MFNLFSKLTNYKDQRDDLLMIEENHAKADRIEFHRTMVRNGPANFKTPTNGQVRRQHARSAATAARKQRKRQVKSFFADQREAALLRSHLQNLTVLPGRDERSYDAVARSVLWVLENFAAELEPQDVTQEELGRAIQQAYDRYAHIVGLESAA